MSHFVTANEFFSLFFPFLDFQIKKFLERTTTAQYLSYFTNNSNNITNQHLSEYFLNDSSYV